MKTTYIFKQKKIPKTIYTFFWTPEVEHTCVDL